MALFLPLIEAFEREKIVYVVVGGLAVVLHGHGRMTADVDIVVGLDPKNAEKAVNVLTSLRYKPRAPVDPRLFADAGIRQSWIKDKGLAVFSFFNQDQTFFEVDLFVEYPMDFNGLRNRSVVKKIGDITVRIAGLDDLISMKRKVGRPQDLEDVKALEELKNAGLI